MGNELYTSTTLHRYGLREILVTLNYWNNEIKPKYRKTTSRNENDGCNLPTNLQGSFLDSTKGLLNFNTTSLSGYNIGSLGSFEFSCFLAVANRFILESNTFKYFDLNWKAYVCWDLNEISSDQYSYYEMSNRLSDAGNERVKMYLEGQTINTNEICALSSQISGSYKILLKNESLSTTSTACPTALQQYFTYTVDVGNGNDSCSDQSTLFGVCSATSEMTFNYTAGCSTQMMAYSSTGIVHCLHSVQANNLTYLTVFNRDYSPTVNDTYQLTCLVLDTSNTSQIEFTQYPKQCQDDQNATYVPSPGAAAVLSYSVESTTALPTTTEPALAAASTDWIIALVVVIILLVIFISIVLVYYYISFKKEFEAKQKKLDDKRAVDTVDGRYNEEDDAFGERGKAPPHLRIMFPDYTKRSIKKYKGKVDVETSYGFDDFDGEFVYDNGFDPITKTYEDKASKEERMSNDSALGMEEDDRYIPPPIAPTPEHRTNHEVKAFRKVHGRQDFKSAAALTDAANSMNLVKKIKKFARKKKRKSEIYQTPEPGFNTNRTEDTQRSANPNYVRGIGKGHETDRGRESKRKVNPENTNPKNATQLDAIDSNLYSSSKANRYQDSSKPSDDDVSSILAGTVLNDSEHQGFKKRLPMKGVHYSPRGPGVIMEDLEEDVSKQYTEGFVSNEPESPQSALPSGPLSTRLPPLTPRKPEKHKERTKSGSETSMTVTPNMKIRRYENYGEGVNPNEPMSLSDRNNLHYIQRLNRKGPKRLGSFRQSKSAGSQGELKRKNLSEDKYKKLLEELYPDKKYFDYTKDSCRPSEEYLSNKTNEGLEYLQQCAEYWEEHQVPERPHSTPSQSKGSKSARSTKERQSGSGGLSRNQSVHTSQYGGNDNFPPAVS
ncbi:hypothetical protein LOTGIDRAFT_233654 [Lottia gigantea]|uniref:DUF7042 domain-containing protein n=1 Tax=Lottia gigantea TaxID=225164 RepID=V4A6J1_LOTGI|nr:hypothetical protein LOTGIDRAFT_233654 [Lottia gigantea]ESO90640.1 hypothetical protein LOTGIDRAFT_233654 [Lottia gigantea]